MVSKGKIIAGSAVLLILAGIVIPRWRTTRESILAEREKAKEKTRAGEAIDLGAVVAKGENEILAYSDLGDAHQTSGEHEEAIAAYERAKGAVDERMTVSYAAIGDALFGEERYNEALEAWGKSKGIVDASRFAEAHYQIGNEHFKQGNYDEALCKFEEAMALGLEDCLIFLKAGRIYYGKRNYDAATDMFEKAAELEPYIASIRFLLGDCYYNQRRHDKAEDEFNRALELNPLYVEAHKALAHVYRELGRIQEAIAIDRKLGELTPENKITFKGQTIYPVK